jgi:AraC-like DNA-binding protein
MEIYREPERRMVICRKASYADIAKSRFHWHRKIEICQALSEGCAFYVDREKVFANQGDIVVINEYNIHQFMMENNATVRFFQLPIDLLLNSRIPIKPIKKHITKEELALVDGLSEKTNTVFDLIEKEAIAEDIYDNPYLCNLASAFYFLLMKHFPDVKASASMSPDRNDFYKITEYINAHYTENINVESIAQSLHIHRGKLPKLFAKYAETDVMTYVNSLRINHANLLLKNGTEITDAALDSGFQSIRTFNNIYKKIMGITPSEYIKTK